MKIENFDNQPIFNWHFNNTAYALHRAGFVNMTYLIEGAVEEHANGDKDVSDTITLNGTHKESGVELNLRLKYIANDGERYDYENDPDCEHPLQFDYTDKEEYYLAEVFVNGAKYYNYNECDEGHANYQLDDDLYEWLTNRWKNGISKWVANGGKFAA